MATIVSSKIREKLAEKHGVSEEEISQCFANREGRLLTDTREERVSEPPTP